MVDTLDGKGLNIRAFVSGVILDTRADDSYQRVLGSSPKWVTQSAGKRPGVISSRPFLLPEAPGR
jgi:hypothetical protein